jgi:hypothetical protein
MAQRVGDVAQIPVAVPFELRRLAGGVDEPENVAGRGVIFGVGDAIGR